MNRASTKVVDTFSEYTRDGEEAGKKEHAAGAISLKKEFFSSSAYSLRFRRAKGAGSKTAHVSTNKIMEPSLKWRELASNSPANFQLKPNFNIKGAFSEAEENSTPTTIPHPNLQNNSTKHHRSSKSHHGKQHPHDTQADESDDSKDGESVDEDMTEKHQESTGGFLSEVHPNSLI